MEVNELEKGFRLLASSANSLKEEKKEKATIKEECKDCDYASSDMTNSGLVAFFSSHPSRMTLKLGILRLTNCQDLPLLRRWL